MQKIDKSKRGFLYAFSNISINDVDVAGIGINYFDYLSLELSLNAEANLFLDVGITPFFNMSVGVGLNGITISLQLNIEETSHKISVGIGLAPVFILAGAALILFSGGSAWSQVVNWLKSLFV